MENIQEQTIRGYQLHELLAQGGMGEVYRATQTVVGREVVIKKILPKYANQPEFIRRFEAEAIVAAHDPQAVHGQAHADGYVPQVRQVDLIAGCVPAARLAVNIDIDLRAQEGAVIPLLRIDRLVALLDYILRKLLFEEALAVLHDVLLRPFVDRIPLRDVV